jgi:hypothetical protein
MATCRAPLCFPTGFSHPVSGALNGAGQVIQHIPIVNSVCNAHRDLGATGAVSVGFKVPITLCHNA